MRFLFVSNPATGQVNPLFAIATELLERGHDVHFCSADTIERRFKRVALALNAEERAVFYGIPSSRAVEDLTPWIQERPHLLHKFGRHAPGQLTSYLNTVADPEDADAPAYRDAVFRVRDVCFSARPDMIIVDNFSPFAMDGVRLSGMPYIQTSPAATCAVVGPTNLFTQHVGMSGADKGKRNADGSRPLTLVLMLFWRNMAFVLSFVYWCATSEYARRKRAFRKDVLGLPPRGFLQDSYMTPTPGEVAENVATLCFNVQGLDTYDASNFADGVFFVGPCFTRSQTIHRSPHKLLTEPSQADVDDVSQWLDQSSETIYINMGSIFYYARADYDNLIAALEELKAKRPQLHVLLKVPNLPLKYQPIPPASALPAWIRRETWVPSVEAVLSHPSVKIAMHHGGGNSFNEAVAFGLPQFIASQWGETHDIALYGVVHGIAVASECPPHLQTDDLVRGFTQLFDNLDDYRSRALRWKMRSWQSGGTQAAADIATQYAIEYRRSHKDEAISGLSTPCSQSTPTMDEAANGKMPEAPARTLSTDSWDANVGMPMPPTPI